MVKEFFVVGNWKMHKTIAESEEFIESISSYLSSVSIKVGVAVPFTALSSVAKCIGKGKVPLKLGAQNMHEKLQGPFTGEISSLMLKEAGVSFVILGHSERRHIFNESNELINQKIITALEQKLEVIFCIGETLEERREGRTEEVIEKQLEKGLHSLSSIDHLTLAYEPVWAIGTGKVASPDDAERVHLFCRSCIQKKFGRKSADHLIIQYGGSVQPDNVTALVSMPNVNGFLVGGASLKAETFVQIIDKCQKEFHSGLKKS